MRRVVVAAAFRLVASRLLLSTIGLKRTRWFVERKSSTRVDHAAAWRLADTVAHAASRLPVQTNCLDRAVALAWMLSAAGLSSALRIGVRKPDELSLAAHAWIEHDGAKLFSDEAGGFLPLDA